MAPDWSTYAARRPSTRLAHLDTAAAGRQSEAILDATAAHARREATEGAYVAGEQVADEVQWLRTALGELVGMPAASVALVESATAAFRALLRSWPLRDGTRVGVVAAEWGPNLELLGYYGHEAVLLDVDAAGRVDVSALERRLRDDPLDAVHLTHVASHRGLVQPVADAVRVCRAAGVPLWVDAAQAVGHVDCASGADAVYATGRKWLAGPRGVGFLAVREDRWADLDVLRAAMGGDASTPAPAFLESHEAHVPGRVGLATAVRELHADGPAAVFARLAEVGRWTADALCGVPGWELVGEPAGAITALRATAGQDVAGVRASLLREHRILTTAALPMRAPREMTGPLLRVSPHVDCTLGDLDRLAAALRAHR